MTFPMKPYLGRGFSDQMTVANYRISRGRRVVENGFGLMANSWRCFLGTLEQRLDVVLTMVGVAVILHNLTRIRFPAIENAEVDNENGNHNIIRGMASRYRRLPSPMFATETFRSPRSKGTISRITSTIQPDLSPGRTE